MKYDWAHKWTGDRIPDVGIAVALLVILTIAFTFTNGYNDASSMVATLLASRVTTPKGAVTHSAIFGLLGAVLGGSAVAFTIQGIIDLPADVLLIYVLLSAVVGAVLWNIITWWYGLPSSSTHALVGGLVGAGITAGGAGSVTWGVSELLSGQLTGVTKVFVFLVLSVIVGFIGGYLLKKASLLLLRNARRTANRPIERLQYITTAALSFAHGANDSQKQMGVITLGLLSAGVIATQDIPLWVRLLSALAIALGTIGGGWKQMKTLSRRIFPINSHRQPRLPDNLLFLGHRLHGIGSTSLLPSGSGLEHTGHRDGRERKDGAVVGRQAHGHLMVPNLPSDRPALGSHLCCFQDCTEHLIFSKSVYNSI
jgi:PiT family inorganic phosphate transporter